MIYETQLRSIQLQVKCVCQRISQYIEKMTLTKRNMSTVQKVFFLIIIIVIIILNLQQLPSHIVISIRNFKLHE